MADELSYTDFGRRFVGVVVTPERVRSTVMSAAGGDMSMEVKLAGGIVSAKGSGAVGDVEVEAAGDEPLTYRATIVADLSLVVRVVRVPHRYEGRLRIPLVLTARTYDDMTILIAIDDVRQRDIDLDLRPAGTAATVIERIGEVGEQVKREVAKLVNQRKAGPELATLTRLDITQTIEEEWARRTT